MLNNLPKKQKSYCIFILNILLVCALQSCSTVIDTTDSTDTSTYPDRITDLTISDYTNTALIAINLNTNASGSSESAGITPLITTSPTIVKKKAPSNTTYFAEFNPLINTNINLTLPHTTPTTGSIQSLASDSPPEFNIAYNGSLANQVTQNATLSYKGTSCNIYVQTSYLTSTIANHVTTIGNFCDTTIHSQAETLFALPYDVDSNGKVIVYVSDIGSSTFYGYFYSADFYLSSLTYTSNQADIIYINIALFNALSSTDPDYSDIYHTLAHEYQHLINFSERFRYLIANNDNTYTNQPYDTWIEEGIAEGATPYLTNNTVQLSSYFNSNLVDTSILDGRGLFTWDSSFYDYVLAFTFLEYCKIQTNLTSDFYKTLMQNYAISSDYEAVYTIIENNTTDLFTDFSDVLIGYRVANLINTSSGIYGYKTNYSPGTITEPSSSSPSIEPGGAVYYTSSQTNAYNSFIPTDVGDNIYYYRINDSGD